MTDLALVPAGRIKALVDLLHGLGIDPLHLHIDGRKVDDLRPNTRLWLRHRTDIERVRQALGIKAKERAGHGPKQREWCAEKDDDGQRLLVQVVSLPHHPDWEERRHG